jgi:RHS repeat-associated protein
MGAFGFTYDAENRQVTSSILGSTTTYAYDGEGRRVWKSTNNAVTYFVYDAMGNLAAEYGPAVTQQCSGRCFVFADQLGSTRMVTRADGAPVELHDYLPYGEDIRSGINGRGAIYGPPSGGQEFAQRFTGKERDVETSSSAGGGLDYFGARYYSGAQGRFTSPDPPLLDQHIDDPQSWNLYSYSRNNPLRYIDPSGNAIELLGDEEQRKKELALLQASMGNDKAASRVYINEVKDGDKTRYFVGIKGDVGDFMKVSDTAHDLANLVGDKNVVEFGITKSDLSQFGGAVTYERGELGNDNVRVLVNPNQLEATNQFLTRPNVLAGTRFEGQLTSPRWDIGEYTDRVASWHEFGHAWGFIHGRPGTQSSTESLQWENRMRDLLYGPHGPHNAHRVRH